VRFVKQPELGRALVVSIRDIEVGEEIFVSYGTRYWMLQTPIRPTFSQIQAMRKKSIEEYKNSIES
jgi:hypothetical protein